MNTNYIATACSSNLIRFSAVGTFSSSDKQELLTAKSNSVQLYRIDGEELFDARQIQLPSAVAGLWAFKPKGAVRDFLVLLTRKYELMVLDFSSDKLKTHISTKGTGRYPNNADLIPLPTGPLAALHAESRTIVLAIYLQRFEVIRFHVDLRMVDCFPIRVDNNNMRSILSLEILEAHAAELSMAMLQGTNKGHLLSFFRLNTKLKEKEKTESMFTKLDLEADLMIHVPLTAESGVVVVGNGTVQYISHAKQESGSYAKQEAVAVSPFLSNIGITAFCTLYTDPGKVVTYLLGGNDGRLILLVCRATGVPSGKGPTCSLHVEFIGIASVAQTLTSIKPGLVFLGTCAGPSSLLIRMRETRNPATKNYFDVLQTFPALGSVLELFVMKNAQKQGLDESCLLACTADTFGNSLTVIRSGIKLEDPIKIDLPGIRRAFCIPASAVRKSLIPLFVLSTLTDTRCCILEDDDLAEITANAPLIRSTASLLCEICSEVKDGLLQVTSSSVSVLNLQTNETLYCWNPPNGEVISTAKHFKGTLIVACGNRIQLLQIEPDRLTPGADRIFDNEISAVDLFADSTGNMFCAVGQWISWSVEIIRVPSTETQQHDLVLSETPPRSLTFCDFGVGNRYFFCGYGDGSMDYFRFDNHTKLMVEPRRVSLGTRAFRFVHFHAHGQANVFVCSDRPCVISYRNGKLSFSNVNVPDIVDVCPVEVPDGSSDALMIVTTTDLLIGQLEDIQKLNFFSPHLGFQAINFAYQPEKSVFAVIGDRYDHRLNKFTSRKSRCEDEEERVLHIVKSSSFEIVTTHRHNDRSELFCCVCSWQPDPTGATDPFFVVGTENKTRGGTLQVLRLVQDRVQVIHPYLTQEPVRNMVAFGRYFITAGETELILYEWLGKQVEIKARFDTCGSMITCLDVLENTVVVADLQKSITIVRFDEDESVFEAVGRDFTSYGFHCVALCDEETAVAADELGNVIVIGPPPKNAVISDVDEQYRLMQGISWISVGDPVTTIKRGLLVSSDTVGECSVRVRNSFIYGTCRGQLGVIFELEERLFALLKHIETQLLSHKKFIGGQSRAESLKFCNRIMEAPHQGFVDGDLVETFLQLSENEMEGMLKNFVPADVENEKTYRVADVIKILDDLVRLH